MFVCDVNVVVLVHSRTVEWYSARHTAGWFLVVGAGLHGPYDIYH